MKRLNPDKKQRGAPGRGVIWLVVGLLAFGVATQAEAEDCRDLTERMLERHPRLLAAKRDVEAAKANVGKVRGGWFPDLKVNGATGQEKRKPANGGKRTDMEAQTLTMTLNQLLWDFGKTHAELAKAELGLLQSELTMNNQRGELILDAATSCVNLMKQYRSMAFAVQSVDNIRKQTGLEESRVELGGGLQTDALQARSQLSGAQARQARARGALNTAINHFRTVFETDPGLPETLFELKNPVGRLPSTLEKVLEEVRDANPQIQLAQVALTTSQMEKSRVIGAELSPRVGAVVEKKYKEDAEGVQGNQQELSARVEMSYPFNLGLAGLYALESAREGMAAAGNRLEDTRRQVEEQARNGWETILSATDNAENLENQARIAAEFLRMARQERLHGARSLIDVLSGETGLINAQSDAESALADVIIAQFGLLKTMGALDLELLQRGKRFELPRADTLADEVQSEPAARRAGKRGAATPKPDRPAAMGKQDAAAPQPDDLPAVADRRGARPMPAASGNTSTPGKLAPPEMPPIPERPTADGTPGMIIQDSPGDAERHAAAGQSSGGEETVIVLKDARLRSKPTMRGKVVQVVESGTTLTVLEQSRDGQWLRVEENGWIAVTLVRPGK
ncbi:MAG: TolC family protein [Magnetococcus sp. YQC-9]